VFSTKKLFRLGRTQRIMMHAGAKNPQPSLATQGIVASQNDRRIFAYQSVYDQLCQQFPKRVNILVLCHC